MLTIILIISNLKSNNDLCSNIKCKYCGSNRVNKFGKQNNKQRYLCRKCKRTFKLEKDNRIKYSNDKRIRVIKMYLEGVGIRSIERLENIPNTLVIKWIKKFGKTIKEEIMKNINNNIPDDIKELKEKKNIEVLEGDEIVTYIKKNLKMGENKYGYGYLLTETGIKLLIFK